MKDERGWRVRGVFVLVVLLGLEAAAVAGLDVGEGVPLFPVALADEREPRTCARYLREAAGPIDSDVVMFGPYTVHCSQPNVSEHPRRVFINGFAYPGANTRLYPGRGAGRLVRLTNSAA